MSLKITDRLPAFKRSVYGVLDDAIREGARDTLITARRTAPFDKGGLRAESDVTRVKLLHQRVRFWKEYARFQEFGGDAQRRVRHYKTAGTGKHFLKTAGDSQAVKISRTLKKHAPRARA